MPITKRSYHAYTGTVTGTASRFGVLMRYAFMDASDSRITSLIGLACLVPSLVVMIVIYVMNNDAVRLLIGDTGSPLPINEKFFLVVMHVQSWPALALTAWVGPRLISADMSNGGLPLLLSRPISRVEYVLAKMVVLAGFLSVVTWVPAVLLFAFQSHVSTKPWAGSHLHILGGMLAGSWLWIAVLCLLSLAVASWVRWRIVATATVIAAVFIPSGFAGVFNLSLRTHWGWLLSLPYMMSELWRRWLHAPPSPFMRAQLPTWSMLLAITALAAVMVLVLNARIRAREVVRG